MWRSKFAGLLIVFWNILYIKFNSNDSNKKQCLHGYQSPFFFFHNGIKTVLQTRKYMPLHVPVENGNLISISQMLFHILQCILQKQKQKHGRKYNTPYSKHNVPLSLKRIFCKLFSSSFKIYQNFISSLGTWCLSIIFLRLSVAFLVFQFSYFW